MSRYISSYVAEFIGTGLLVLLGCGSAVLAGSHIGFIGVSFAFGFTLMALAYIIGPVSGCHINPGVTIGLALAGKFDKARVIPYIFVQILGAILGAYVLQSIAVGMPGFDITKGFALNGFGELSPSHASMISVAITEVVLTGVLIFAVLGTTEKGFPMGFGPLLVGVTLVVLLLVAIPLSNASLNFARSFGPAVVSMNAAALQQLPYFFVFNGVGAVLGVILHKVIRCDSCVSK